MRPYGGAVGIAGSSDGLSRPVRQPKTLVVVVQLAADGFDDQVMVFALGQAGDGDASDDAGSGDMDGKAAAVSGVFGVGESVSLAECGVVELEIDAELVGTAVEAGDHVRFALDPAGVVRCGPGQGSVEERLVRLAEAANVNDEGVAAGDGEFTQGAAESPGGFGIEGGEDELRFLPGDGDEIVVKRHGCSIVQAKGNAEMKMRSGADAITAISNPCGRCPA